MSAELLSAPSHSLTETPVAPVLPSRDPLESRFRNFAARATLVFAAAISPVIGSDSALAGPGQSPTTHKDNGPKCMEVFSGDSSQENSVYLKTIGAIHSEIALARMLHNNTTSYLNGDTSEARITLDCDIQPPNGQNSDNS